MHLEGSDVFQLQSVRRSAKISAQLRNHADVGSLRRRRQIADCHVLDHAAAKRAQIGPSQYSCLRGWAPTPTSSQPGGALRHLAVHAAVAASFNPVSPINRNNLPK